MLLFLKLEFFSKETEQFVFITENVLSFIRFKSVISRKGIRFFEHFQMWNNVEIDIFLESSDIFGPISFQCSRKSNSGKFVDKNKIDPAIGNAKKLHLKIILEKKNDAIQIFSYTIVLGNLSNSEFSYSMNIRKILANF